jgi:uncharacterized protein (UPF0335 family)
MSERQLTNNPAVLAAVVNELEDLARQREQIDGQIAQQFRDAAQAGYDRKVLKRLLAKRAGDKAGQTEEEALLSLYEGMLAKAGAS